MLVPRIASDGVEGVNEHLRKPIAFNTKRVPTWFKPAASSPRWNQRPQAGRRVSRGSVDTGLFQQVFNAHIFKRIRNSSTRHKDAGDPGCGEARLERVLHRPEMGTSR